MDESFTGISQVGKSIYIDSGFHMFKADENNQGKFTTDIRIYNNYNM